MTIKYNIETLVDCIISDDLVDYEEAMKIMESRVKMIQRKQKRDLVWLLQHPSVYTAGTSADPAELLDKKNFPVIKTGRGGRFTYHGPGQRIAYVMIDLKLFQKDVRLYVKSLEEWIINTLQLFNISALRRKGLIGLWTKDGSTKGNNNFKKIVSIGIRVQKGVAFHGVSINLDPNLSHFSGIIPCGIEGVKMTSIWDLGITPSMFELDLVLRRTFEKKFGVKTELKGDI